MADGEGGTSDGVGDQRTPGSGRPKTTPLQYADTKADGVDCRSDDPSPRRRCGIALFTANAGCVQFLWMIGVVYTGAVVRTLERRFGLRSTQTGMMMACGDILHMCIVIFVGYFGRHGHKPRIMSVMALFSALGNFLMVLPHWVYNDAAAPSSQYNSSSSSPVQSEFCAAYGLNRTSAGGIDVADSAAGCDDSQPTSNVHPALYLFVVAQLLVGFGGCGVLVLSFPYIYENASKTKASLYLGVLATLFSLGPVCGNLLPAATLKLPENIAADVSTTLLPGDPRWIGCWWLGYLLVAVGILVMSVPLWFFPASMTDRRRRQSHCSVVYEDSAPAHGSSGRPMSLAGSTLKQTKEFPRRLFHLLRNRPFLCIVTQNVCGTYIIMGVFASMVRYLEIAFRQQAAVASVISALCMSMSGALGGFAGGFVASKMKLQVRGAVRLMILSSVAFLVGAVILMLLRCPQLNVAGKLHPDDGRFTVSTECSRHCACSINRKSYDPVCGSDNLTYFSACFAGCTRVVNETYVDCRCVTSETGRNSSRPEMRSHDVTARRGSCLSGCSTVVVFAAVLFVATLLRSLERVPDTIVSFSVVNKDERSFAVAINSFAMYLLGFVPAPILFGALIDSTCRLWVTTTDGGVDSTAAAACGRRGSCLLFDTDQLRWRTYGVVSAFQFLQLMFVLLLYSIVRRRRFHDDELNAPRTTSANPSPTVDVLEMTVD